MVGGIIQGGVDTTNSIIDGAWDMVNYQENKKRHYNQIQHRVNDMKHAGINPMLAVGGGVQSSAMPVPQRQHAQKSNIGQVINSAKQIGIESKKQKNLERLSHSQSRANTQKAELDREKKYTESEIQHYYIASADKLRAEKLLVQSQVPKVLADTKLSTAQSARALQEKLRTMYEIQKKKSQSHIYKGKKGKFFGYADWLLNKFSRPGFKPR